MDDKHNAAERLALIAVRGHVSDLMAKAASGGGATELALLMVQRELRAIRPTDPHVIEGLADLDARAATITKERSSQEA